MFWGFSLSPLAIHEFAKRKGISLTWHRQTDYTHTNKEQFSKIIGIPTSDKYRHTPAIKDCGANVVEIPSALVYYPDFDNAEMRCDPDLIAVIEELGFKANGICAELAIENIPDGVDFEITEYDGSEEVVPPRRSW